MQAKLETEDAKKLYSRRKQTVEPVFGIIKAAIGFTRFRLRGLLVHPAANDGARGPAHRRTDNRALGGRAGDLADDAAGHGTGARADDGPFPFSGCAGAAGGCGQSAGRHDDERGREASGGGH